MEKVKSSLNALIEIMNELREKCPWDKKQTIESLREKTIEEVYEPYLIKEGFIQRTSRGRKALDKTFTYLDIEKSDNNDQVDLF